MANNRNDDSSEDQRQELAENDADDNERTLAKPLQDAQAVTRKPGIKPS